MCFETRLNYAEKTISYSVRSGRAFTKSCFAKCDYALHLNILQKSEEEGDWTYGQRYVRIENIYWNATSFVDFVQLFSERNSDNDQ